MDMFHGLNGGTPTPIMDEHHLQLSQQLMMTLLRLCQKTPPQGSTVEGCF